MIGVLDHPRKRSDHLILTAGETVTVREENGEPRIIITTTPATDLSQ